MQIGVLAFIALSYVLWRRYRGHRRSGAVIGATKGAHTD